MKDNNCDGSLGDVLLSHNFLPFVAYRGGRARSRRNVGVDLQHLADDFGSRDASSQFLQASICKR